MSGLADLARDPQHRRRFEKLLVLAARRGDADLVTERLSWGIDPNCCLSRGRTPLMINVRGSCPSAATVRALLERGADPSLIDETGLSALDYARRKLARLQLRPRRPRPRPESPALDENRQLQLDPEEQAELDALRREVASHREHPGHDVLRVWWRERLRAARRVFNDPDQVERIVEILEAAAGPE